MEQDITIQLDKKVEEIIRKNLNETVEEYTETIKHCKDCMYYEGLWLRGRTLHCCGNQSDNPITSREIGDVYRQCPIDHQLNRKRTYIKRYGIRHYKPSRYDGGCFVVGDFEGTTFEDDGYNPDVEFKAIATFYYDTEEEKARAEEMALHYYNKFNLDAEYVKKICYG